MQQESWLCEDVESLAKDYAISEIIPKHCQQVAQQKKEMVDKVEAAVKARLTSEIQYWDFRASELQMKEKAGKVNAKLNSKLAARRAEELSARLQKRLEELSLERKVSAVPPVIVGGALIVPHGWFICGGGGSIWSESRRDGTDRHAACHGNRARAWL